MKVTEHLKNQTNPISFEIVPPVRGSSFEKLKQTVSELAQYNPKPPFIDVTSHAGRYIVNDNGNKGKKRKNPGTFGLCSYIQNTHNIDSVPHILCKGFTREETEDLLIDLNFVGINNVLALRGDDLDYEFNCPPGRDINRYASDLVSQIQNMNDGFYLDGKYDEKTDFQVGVGGYPEKHHTSPDWPSQMRYLKKKVDAGAEYIVTQMFFDNQKYFDYVKRCQDHGITVPIIPGLKIFTNKNQLVKLPEYFHLEFPKEFLNYVNSTDDKEKIKDFGAQWAAQQTDELFQGGAPAVHFYVMQSANPVHSVMALLKRD